VADRFGHQRQAIEPPVQFCDVIRAEAEARQSLALFGQHGADTARRLAVAAGRHQLDRHVVEREQHAVGAIAAVLPGRRTAEQRLIGGGALLDVAGENDDVVEARDHGKSPRVFLAARTFSTPIAIAAVRCAMLSAFARCSIWSKARSRIWYSRRVTSSSSQNNCCRSCTHSK